MVYQGTVYHNVTGFARERIIPKVYLHKIIQFVFCLQKGNVKVTRKCGFPLYKRGEQAYNGLNDSIKGDTV